MIGVIAGLVLYSVAVLAAAPRLLPTLTAAGTTPRLAITAWLSAIATVAISLAAATALIAIAAINQWMHPRAVASTCLAGLQHMVHGDAGVGPQIALFALIALVSVAAAVATARLTSAVMGMRSRAHEHARAVRLVGRRTSDDGVVMVQASKPAAYCVTGRPAAIVITSAARDALDDHQMAAVLAHERAHLAGHHAAIVSTMRALAAALPRLNLVTQGAQQISRLLEMCADDVAARRHSSRALLTGLVALTTAAPAEALAAADLAVLARAERLASRPNRSMKLKAGAVLASITALMAAAPLITVTACIWASHNRATNVNLTAAASFPAPPSPQAMDHNHPAKENSMMMMNHSQWGWGGWLPTTVSSILFWALVIGVLVLLARYLLSLAQRTTNSTDTATHAEATLAERYAQGEIDDDEYQRRLRLLRGQANSTATL